MPLSRESRLLAAVAGVMLHAKMTLVMTVFPLETTPLICSIRS
jgi:hypothetical protein